MFKKMMLLAVSAAALVAFAVPASASAAVFTHEGAEVTSNISGEYQGAAGFTAGAGGVHCPTIDVAVTLKPGGMGTVTAFKGTGCTTTPDNFPVHATAEGLPWTIDATGANTAEITNIKIHNSVRHPATTHQQIATNTLTGNVKATFSGTSVTLSNGVGGLLVNHLAPATVNGTLLEVSETEFGVK